MVYWDISFYTKGSHGLSFFIMRGCRTSVYNLLDTKNSKTFATQSAMNVLLFLLVILLP